MFKPARPQLCTMATRRRALYQDILYHAQDICSERYGQLVNQQNLFSVRAPFVPCCLGLIRNYYSQIINFIHCRSENEYSAVYKFCSLHLTCRVQKFTRQQLIYVPGTKIVLGSDKVCVGTDTFLLYIQRAGCKFAPAPFSSRPGGYKGEIDQKSLFLRHGKIQMKCSFFEIYARNDMQCGQS